MIYRNIIEKKKEEINKNLSSHEQMSGDSYSLRDNHKSIFAGSYLDEAGKLHFNLVNKSNINEIENMIPDHTIIHYVDFSLEELESTFAILNKNMKELKISINEKDNKIYVYLKNEDKEIISKINSIVDSKIIEYG